MSATAAAGRDEGERAGTVRRIPGATTTYRLNEDGTVVVRQGSEDTAPVRFAHGVPVRAATSIGTYPDGGVWLFRFKHFYEIGTDDIARPLAEAEHQRRTGA